MVSSPVVLSSSMVDRALQDPTFYQKVPEFIPLRAKLEATKSALSGTGGCSGCRRKRVIRNMFHDFLLTTRSLSPDASVRMKQYFGIERMMFNSLDQAGRMAPTIL